MLLGTLKSQDGLALEGTPVSGANRQILELAKAGLCAEEIAQALGHEVGAVELVLSADLEVSRELDMDGEFSNLTKAAFQTLQQVMLGGENESARVKAASYVLDYKCGLKKPAKNVTFNIAELNLKLREARSALQAPTVDAVLVN